MRNLKHMLRNKTVNGNKLVKYGFTKQRNTYVYKTKIYNDQFEVIVTFSNDNNTSMLVDLATEEEYILVDIEDLAGEFVGKVREEYNNKLQDIINKCTDSNVFKGNQTKDVIKYIKEKYNDDLEFLWEKYDNNAIWRNKINNKWYALLLTVTEEKLKIDSNKEIEIIDLMYQKDKIKEIVDNKRIYPGYHMNKKSWITIILDGTLDSDEIFQLIDNSYNISVKKK